MISASVTGFTPAKFNAWNKLVKDLDSVKQVDFTVSIADVKQLKADRVKRKFILEPLFNKAPTTNEEVNKIKKQLFENLPFYDNLLYNGQGTLQTAIYINKDIVNTPARRNFIADILIIVGNLLVFISQINIFFLQDCLGSL